MTTDQPFEALLSYIRQSRGFDFTGYKRSSLERRVHKRMQMIAIETYSDYLDYLEVHPDEFLYLFNTLLINVTAFFRDRAAWEYLTREVLTRIVAQKPPEEPIRIWSAGCSTGEEAYSLAMALAELIGLEQFSARVKIYATDVDEEALNQARQAAYSLEDITNISPELLNLYFKQSGNCWVFRKDLRRSVIFGRHDLIQDVPISKVDLLVCRNTLMYFNAETQAKILARFHFALRDGGALFLGKAEMLLTHADIFTPLDLNSRIFTKVADIPVRARLLTKSLPGILKSSSSYLHLNEIAFDRATVAQIVVDVEGRLAIANGRARILFTIPSRYLGRPLQEFEISYHPVELRSCIEQVYRERHVINIHDVAWQSEGEAICLDVQVAPLTDFAGNLLGAGITFTDITRSKRLQEELEHSNQKLEMAYEELQSTNEELETTNEELQTANEELQSTNEELQTMNEELQFTTEELQTMTEELQFTNEGLQSTNEGLQSTNEGLQTMNEELQSTNEGLQTMNEELQTVNDKLQRRSEELDQTNLFLESILTSLRGGVVVVNRDLQVQIWNHRSEDLWGLRSEEAIGQNFLNLEIGLPVAQLRAAIRRCLSNGSTESLTETEVTLPATNRRGKPIQCRTTCMPLLNSAQAIQGVILLMEQDQSTHSPSSERS